MSTTLKADCSWTVLKKGFFRALDSSELVCQSVKHKIYFLCYGLTEIVKQYHTYKVINRLIFAVVEYITQCSLQ